MSAKIEYIPFMLYAKIRGDCIRNSTQLCMAILCIFVLNKNDNHVASAKTKHNFLLNKIICSLNFKLSTAAKVSFSAGAFLLWDGENNFAEQLRIVNLSVSTSYCRTIPDIARCDMSERQNILRYCVLWWIWGMNTPLGPSGWHCVKSKLCHLVRLSHLVGT